MLSETTEAAVVSQGGSIYYSVDGLPPLGIRLKLGDIGGQIAEAALATERTPPRGRHFDDCED
jgi:hypothetical protein